MLAGRSGGGHGAKMLIAIYFLYTIYHIFVYDTLSVCVCVSQLRKKRRIRRGRIVREE